MVVLMPVLMFIYRKTSHGKFSDVLEKVEPLLSGIKWDSQGYIIGAKATILNWILKKVRQQLNVLTADFYKVFEGLIPDIVM
jgi:hypothetical protein